MKYKNHAENLIMYFIKPMNDKITKIAEQNVFPLLIKRAILFFAFNNNRILVDLYHYNFSYGFG